MKSIKLKADSKSAVQSKDKAHEQKKIVELRCRINDYDAYRFRMIRMLTHPTSTQEVFAEMLDCYLEKHPNFKEIANNIAYESKK